MSVIQSEGKMWQKEATFWRIKTEEKDRELSELRGLLL